MKRVVFVYLILSQTVAFSQVIKETSPPYGMLEIRPGLYVDDTETTVAEWLEFYYYSSTNREPIANPNYLPSFPPTHKPAYAFLFDLPKNTVLKLDYGGIFTTAGNDKLPLPKDSINSKKAFKEFRKRYLDLPIAFVSYEQALAYCAWRMAKMNAAQFTRLVFSLPSREEFALLSENLDSVRVVKKRALPSGNYADVTVSAAHSSYGEYRDSGKKPMRVASFYSNDNQLYDVQGNLAEMTLENGISLGGSYWHSYHHSLKEKAIPYSKPESWLGFRCIAKKE